MGVIPFIPFFALKDFGQMLVFSGAYATLYLVAVRRWPQLLLPAGIRRKCLTSHLHY